ncbi:Gti1/Pac2 family-domain-containing protein [Fomitopsis serialis]|uniref:Gti1/Pac2 family-domain-containing protein n=1 Tax=Fomitopsis serialis TaxID=139415 RepID=UPI002007AF08|nr:Gti1/Pac2 family-domain-containing protein [Neoantrodia serialis]KAH9926753.1 Gti1/Pac2 family-domain-containing protein [Neoantrodia serialis]
MQQPTLQSVRVRSTRDACQIFYAVARNALRMTTHRLDAEERRAIKSGNVYVWEERCANAEATGMGMERWTDGMGWGPSRVRDDFLFYHQRESGLNEDSGPARWATMMKGREPRGGKSTLARSDAERLIKQTYSVHVSLPEDRPRGVTRKWHLTAYFSQTTLDSLGTIDEIRNVGDVPSPEGWFRSARASKGKRAETGSGDELVSAQDPWGLGFQPSPSHGMSQFPVEPAFATQGMQFVGPASVGQGQHPAYTYGHRQTARADYPPVAGTSVQAYGASQPSARPHLPTLQDAGLKSYRDPSPLNFTSSNSASSSSDYDASPRLPFASPLTPPPVNTHPKAVATHPERSSGGPRDLVPLDVLQAASRIPRDPVDEQFLRKLSKSRIRNADVPRSLAGSPHERLGAPGFDGDDRKPRITLQAEW